MASDHGDGAADDAPQKAETSLAACGTSKGLSSLELQLRKTLSKAHAVNASLSSLKAQRTITQRPPRDMQRRPSRDSYQHPPYRGSRDCLSGRDARRRGDDDDGDEDDMEADVAGEGLASAIVGDFDRRRLERAVMDQSTTSSGDTGSRDGRADSSMDWNKDKLIDKMGRIDVRKERLEGDLEPTGNHTRSHVDGRGDSEVSMDTDRDTRDGARNAGREQERPRERRRERDGEQNHVTDRPRDADGDRERPRHRAPPGHDLRLLGSRDRRSRPRQSSTLNGDHKPSKPKADAKTVGRNKRILGLLTKTLSLHTKEVGASVSTLERTRLEIAERKRSELDRQMKKDKDGEVTRLKDMIQEKRELASQIRKLMEDKDKALVATKRRLRLAFHIQTEADPPIHWLPKEHTQTTSNLLEQQREAISWVDGEEVELVGTLNDEDERLHSLRPRTFNTDDIPNDDAHTDTHAHNDDASDRPSKDRDAREEEADGERRTRNDDEEMEADAGQ